MSWLGGKKIAQAVIRSLGLDPGDSIVVGFDSKLAARLAASGFEVTFVSDVERDIQRATTKAVALGELGAPSPAMAGAVVVGAAARDDRDTLLETFGSQTARGARIAMIDRASRPVATRTALLGGLSDLDQETVGRMVITVGRRSEVRFPASLEN